MRLGAFPEGDSAWRIDWFGDIAFPNRLLHRRQPSVFVHLSPVVDPRALTSQAGPIHPAATDFARGQIGRWVSVGTLPLLRVGDIWRNQQLVSQPEYELETFHLLHINPETSTLVKAGLNKDDKGFLLPLLEHPWHRRSTHSYCIEIRLPNECRIIVPCMELIRFYFGSSSGLLTQLFLPPLKREALYTQAEFDWRTRLLTLALAPRISGASAADIGRLHLSRHAWHAALAVGTSMLKASTADQAIHPQCFFPFEGVTNLTATGKWLPCEGKPNQTFIVFSLRSCSNPFPFRSLKYEVSRARECPHWTRQGRDATPNGEHKKQFRGSAAETPNQRLMDRDPSNRLTPLPKHLHIELRFPDLLKKPIWREHEISNGYTEQSTLIATPDISEIATGEPGSERRIRAVDLQVAMASSKQPPAFLIPLLDRLKQMHEAAITLLTASEQDNWTVPVPLSHDEDGEINPRLFVVADDGKTHLRRIAIFLVKFEDAIHHYASIEGSEEFLCFPCMAVNGERTEDVLARASSLLLKAE